MNESLSHLNTRGEARMVDVGDKPVQGEVQDTQREKYRTE